LIWFAVQLAAVALDMAARTAAAHHARRRRSLALPCDHQGDRSMRQEDLDFDREHPLLPVDDLPRDEAEEAAQLAAAQATLEQRRGERARDEAEEAAQLAAAQAKLEHRRGEVAAAAPGSTPAQNRELSALLTAISNTSTGSPRRRPA
jgi:hypothetical protein